MMSIIQEFTLIDRSDAIGPGGDGWFVGVRSDGQCGWYGPINTAAGRYIDRHLACRLVGRPVHEYASTFQFMQRSTTNSIAEARTRSWAIGAVDCALWDLRGQLAGLPVAQLLNPNATALSVPAYASWLAYDLAAEQAANQIAQIACGGWKFTKWGLRMTGRRTPDELTQLANGTIHAAGGSAAFDAFGTWSVDLVHSFVDSIESTDLIWLEDPLSADQTDDYPRVETAAVPLAAGEYLLVDDQPDALLRIRNLTALTIDVVGCGGITRALRLIEQAKQHGIPIVPHGRSLVPALHLAAAFPKVIPCVEYQIQWEPRRQALYTAPQGPKLGTIPVGQAPGLGLIPRSIDAS